MSSPSTSGALTLRQSVALVWRTLRSMRTAIILLFMMAGAAVVGSLVPQIPNSPERVQQYQASHPLIGDFYLRAGFFDVFGSWWFALITALLFVSLIACLIPRTRGTIRNLRQRPIHARELDALRHYQERPVAAEPEAAIASSQKVLRRRLFRLARADSTPALAAEKGAAREAGSLLFHWAFLLILVAAIYGKGTGFTGRAVIIEGQTWTDALANYDGQIREGRFFDGDFSGVQVKLNDFADEFGATGVPMDFVSNVDLYDAQGNFVRSEDIRVNHPASFGGLRMYQFGFGWAPDLQVHQDGALLWSGPVGLAQAAAPDGVSQLAMPWTGVLKIPSVSPPMGIRIELWPDGKAFLAYRLTGQRVPMVKADRPVVLFTTYRGPLVDPSLASLDTTGMRLQAHGLVGQGQITDLTTGTLADASAGGITISFPDLKQYSVLQVSRDRGVWIMFLAAILVLLGLLPALYTSRRKVWVRAETDGGTTVLKVGGFALQRKAQFEEEFAKLVDELERAAGGPAPVREKAGAR